MCACAKDTKAGFPTALGCQILGVWYFNFIPYYEQHHSEDIIGWQGRAELPHNTFIQLGTDAGFTGLAVFGLLITSYYVGTRRIIRAAKPIMVYLYPVSVKE